MFKVILSFVLTVFLFVGIIGTALLFISDAIGSDRNSVTVSMDNYSDRISIREIEVISAANNLRFTSKNSLR